jgi:molybdopterin synthase catalytic subunit
MLTISTSGEPLVSLREGPASVDEVSANVAHGGAGAVCVFAGTVRNHSEGREVTRLEYQAYAPMAVREMQRIVEELRGAHPDARLAVIHRVGSLAVGELAVACAASAPHRDEAFAVCRALIDQIKARVPIWKREVGPDGAAWVGWQDARCAHEHHATSLTGRPSE